MFKRKILSILFVMVIALSLCLVTAAPAAAAVPGSVEFTTDGGTAEWSTGALHSGAHSVLLTATNPESASVGIPVNLPLSAITQLSFWYNHKVNSPAAGHVLGPDMVLILLKGSQYYLAYRGGAVASVGSWLEADPITPTNFAESSGWGYGSCNADLSGYSPIAYRENGYILFVDLQSALSGATVLYAAVNLDPPGVLSTGSVYVDDITVNTIAYDLEPESAGTDLWATGELPTAAELANLGATPAAMTVGLVAGSGYVPVPEYTNYTGVDLSVGGASEIYGVTPDGTVVQLTPDATDPDLHFHATFPAGTYLLYVRQTSAGTPWVVVTIVHPCARDLAFFAQLATTPATMTVGLVEGSGYVPVPGYTSYTGVDLSAVSASEIYGVTPDGEVVQLTPDATDPDLHFHDTHPAGTYLLYVHQTAGGWLKVTINQPTLIGVSVTPTSINFGSLTIGVASEPEEVMLTNIGNVKEDFSSSLAGVSSPDVYTNGLKLDGEPAGTWAEWGGGDPEDTYGIYLVLTIPGGTAPGTYTATLVFWAEASD